MVSFEPVSSTPATLVGSVPHERYALLAQLVEQVTLNHRVGGSSPSQRTNFLYYSTSSLTYRVRLLLDRCSADA